ncbi:FxLYD domain-containing protein, partial [Escherichia coli]
SHWSTSKTPSYTKSVSWQHHPNLEPGQKWKIQAFINTFNGSPDSFKVTEVKIVN